MYDYILSRIYDLDFPHKSNISDKEALFIPTGFDSPELIEQTDLRAVKDIANRMSPGNVEPTYEDIVVNLS